MAGGRRFFRIFGYLFGSGGEAGLSQEDDYLANQYGSTESGGKTKTPLESRAGPPVGLNCGES